MRGVPTPPAIDERATELTRARYDRLASRYDWTDERRVQPFSRRRPALWQRVRGPRVLELGVGMGKNMPYCPPGVHVTMIDLSPRKLERAQARARRDGVAVDLRLANIQALPFPDAAFDSVVATFVFCSVPNPLLGLAETRRVLRPGGQLVLLEHVLTRQPALRLLMRLANGLMVRVMSANIHRETVENVHGAGLWTLMSRIGGLTSSSVSRPVGPEAGSPRERRGNERDRQHCGPRA